MRLSLLAPTATALLTASSTLSVFARPAYRAFQQQRPFSLSADMPEDHSVTSDGGEVDMPVGSFGASHLSEWCRLSKEHFLEDLKKGDAKDWMVVMGNEAGGERFLRSPCSPGDQRRRACT